ncbi:MULTISPECIES: hypothetical protein [Nitrosopumilus]|uniref:Uncharacterized protein n=1 Tax=Nitrosopumilus piranensis TaxID=1582439 RepID=A0A0C5BWK1_9ARCH|nr:MULTISPECIES: hypothetical protein [Nitrosopumilus]AJM92671.1 hypothetical protein NPIRD3C_1459 [Nitrosopumilus piranensis]KAF6244532.1 hypothetical protein C6989_09745 [Nitrosopumilus sp. b2]
MGKLPEKFPEYSIMYKTITNQIKSLEKQREQMPKNELNELNLKIQKYENELDKIRKMFPNSFFEDI